MTRLIRTIKCDCLRCQREANKFYLWLSELPAFAYMAVVGLAVLGVWWAVGETTPATMGESSIGGNK